MLQHITQATRHLIIWGLVAAALFITLVRILLSVVEVYKEDLADILSQELAAPVTIHSLGAGMRGFRPELVLNGVQIFTASAQPKLALKIQAVRLSMSLLQSYGQQQMLASSRITLVGAQLTLVRRPDGSIGIQGLTSGDSAPPVWLLQTAQFELLDSRITWRDELPRATQPEVSTRSISFDKVNVILSSSDDAQHHAIQVSFTPPEQYGETLNISMQLRGNFLASKGINGLIYLEGNQVQLAKLLADYALSQGVTVQTGKASMQLWSYWQRSQLLAITGNLQLQQAVLRKPKQVDLNIGHLSQQFNWHQQDNGWQLRIDQFNVETNGQQINDVKLLLQGNLQPAKPIQHLELQLPQAEVPQLVQLGCFWGIETLPCAAHNLQGYVRDVSLTLAPETQTFSVQADFAELSLPPQQTLPGFSHLKGHIQGSQQQGRLTLEATNSALDLPHIFAAPLPIDTLQTEVSWQQTTQNWEILSDKLLLKVPDLQADARLQLKINRTSHAVWMDLKTLFTGNSAINRFSRYWPVGLMGKAAADWLAQAFPKGQVQPRSAVFSGALADFPFQQRPGEFKLILDFKATDLHYADAWQPIEDIDAQVVFHNESMRIHAQHAKVQGVQLQQLDLNLPAFSASDYLNVAIKGAHDITHTLKYLHASPLKPYIAQLSRFISPKGLAPLDLNIQVPIVEHAALKVQAALQLQQAQIRVLPLDLPVTQLQGTLHFDTQGLVRGQLYGRAFNNPIKVLLTNNTQHLQVDVLGQIDVLDLQQHFEIPLWRYAQGATEYQLNLNIPHDEQPVSVLLSSELNGIRLKLPDVLAKNPGASETLKASLLLSDKTTAPLEVRLGQQFKATALVDTKHQRLNAAEILVGQGDLTGSVTKGGRLSLNLSQCELADWLTLVKQSGISDRADTPFFTQVQLHSAKAAWRTYPLGALDLKMQHEQARWNITIDSNVLQGKIVSSTAKNQDEPTILTLSQLDLSTLSQLKMAEATEQHAKLQRLPRFNLTAAQVLWNTVNLGSLGIETARSGQNLTFTRFNLKNARGALDLTGEWRMNADKQFTNARGTLTLRQFGDLLADLAVSKELKATDAKVKLDINWPGAPHHFTLAQLEGQVGVELKDGRILSIEPGLGRLLGFLAFEQWERRLRLDFSDMLAKGLTFNRIHGRFDLQQGAAVTSDLTMDAVPAEVNITGLTHLAERTLNYRAKVLPKSSAALPIAGTLVDRTVTYALEKITGTSQAGFLLGSEYQILGPWQDPQVIRLREQDGLLQKTWYGLTDFSWLRKPVR